MAKGITKIFTSEEERGREPQRDNCNVYFKNLFGSEYYNSMSYGYHVKG